MRTSIPSIGSANHIGYTLLSLIASIALFTQPCLAEAASSDALAQDGQDIINIPAPEAAPRHHDRTTTTKTFQQRQPLLTPREAGGELQEPLVIFNYSSNYNYAGCYNDTNLLSKAGLQHALNHVLLGEGYLTAPLCLEWCAHNGTAVLGRPYKFAGLEYSRECYCGEDLNPLVVKLTDSACDTYCDGDNSTACGGANRLSLYNITDSALKSSAAAGVETRHDIARLVVLGLCVAIWSSLGEVL